MSSIVETAWYLDEVDSKGDIVGSHTDKELSERLVGQIRDCCSGENFAILYLERTRYPRFTFRVYRDYIIISSHKLPDNYTNGEKLKIPKQYKAQLETAYSQNIEAFELLFGQDLPDWNSKVNIGASGFPEYTIEKRMWVTL